MMYLVFAHTHYEAGGGMNDCSGVFSTLNAAIATQAHLTTDYARYYADIYEARNDGLWLVWQCGAMVIPPKRDHPLRVTP